MTNETEIIPSVVVLAPVDAPTLENITPEAPLAPIVLEEQRYEYQPTDEQGRPLGGKQVIKYRTQEEFAAKFAEQNTLLLRKLRNETRKNRLGIVDNDTIGEEAPRFQKPVTFSPKNMTPDEKTSLAFSLGVDPEDFDGVTDDLFEAKIGVKPAVLRELFADIQSDRLAAQANTEVDAFKRSNPEFVMCQENSDAMTNWMLRYNLAPVRGNFQRAYDTLRAAGILIENAPALVIEPEVILPVEQPVHLETPPVVLEDIPAVLEPILEPVLEPELPPATKPVISRVPVSLSRTNADESGPVPVASGSDIVYEVNQGAQKRRFTGLAAVDAMPADEYRRRVMSDPNFQKKVEKLEAEKAARRKRG